MLIQDADLEYNPQDYGALLDPFERGLAAVQPIQRRSSPRAVFLAFGWQPVLKLLSNMFTGLNLTDGWTSYQAFRREVSSKS